MRTRCCLQRFPTDGLGRLGAHLPLAWIEESLACTGTASIRRRRLPAEQVVWLVIALALYRGTSMSEVLESLGLGAPEREFPRRHAGGYFPGSPTPRG